MNKKTLALLLLLGFGISLAYAVKFTPRQQRLAASARSERRTNRSAKSESAPAEPKPVPEESPRYAGYHADLFRPLFDSPPEPKPKMPAAFPQAPPIPLPPLPLEPLEPPEPPMSRKLAAFTYLGQLNEGDKCAIFLKGKERVFVVRTGDKFGPKKEFRLAQVTEREIRIALGERDELISITLEKKKSLNMDSRAVPRARTAMKYPPPLLPDPEGETL